MTLWERIRHMLDYRAPDDRATDDIKTQLKVARERHVQVTARAERVLADYRRMSDLMRRRGLL